MKRLLVANLQKHSKSRYLPERFETMLKAQIHNLLEVGWKKENIIFLSNFNFEWMGIKSELIELNDFCLSGSKMWGMKFLFDNHRVTETIYAGDIDTWQNIWFDEPEIQDVGACQYSSPKWNGGSIFWKPESRDLLEKIIELLTRTKAKSEEPSLNIIFKSEEYRDRITHLNSTYNVGCSGFFERFTGGEKPIKVVHFHPANSIAWEIHGLNRDGVGAIAVTVRLERLLRRYYPWLATELKDKTIPQQKVEKREIRIQRRAEKLKVAESKNLLGVLDG